MAMGIWLRATAAELVLGLVLVASGAAAHHSVSGQFDMNQRTTIVGTITKVDWINPHTYIYMDVVDESGKMVTWRLESLPTAMLRKAGLTSQLIMGDGGKVTADALLARDGTANLGWLLKLTYEDGHTYQLAGE
jgi:hypothetical protein